MNVISDIRTVPVGEDLTTEETRLSVLRGFEHMNRVDFPLAVGATLDLGEWAALQADGTVARPTTTPVALTYLVMAGTDRFDTKATGQVTCVMNSLIVAKTTRYKTDDVLVPGSPLTAKLIAAGPSAGVAGLTLQSGSQPIHGRCISVAGGVLTFSTTSP